MFAFNYFFTVEMVFNLLTVSRKISAYLRWLSRCRNTSISSQKSTSVQEYMNKIRWIYHFFPSFSTLLKIIIRMGSIDIQKHPKSLRKIGLCIIWEKPFEILYLFEKHFKICCMWSLFLAYVFWRWYYEFTLNYYFDMHNVCQLRENCMLFFRCRFVGIMKNS